MLELQVAPQTEDNRTIYQFNCAPLPHTNDVREGLNNQIPE
jgi:hypothetical protein